MTASFEKNLELIDTIMFDSLGFFYIKDQDSNFIYANKAMLAYFGFYQQKEITGKSTYDLFPHHNAELLVKNDQIILEINEEKQFIEYFNNELSYYANEFFFIINRLFM
jgi:PAS domain S-box-containing protein